MVDQPPPIVDDVFSINPNPLNEILLIQLLYVSRDITTPFLKLSSSPYDRQDSASDLMGIFAHSELEVVFKRQARESKCSRELRTW